MIFHTNVEKKHSFTIVEYEAYILIKKILSYNEDCMKCEHFLKKNDI